MSLGDVVIERSLTHQEAKEAICTLWNIRPEEVVLIGDISELAEVNQPRKVLCQMWTIPGGDYHTVLSFHEGEFMELPRIGTVEKLSAILRCRCLVLDGSANPYLMIMVGGQEDVKLVALDAEKLDNGEYVVMSSA